MRLIICDDSFLFREGLARVLAEIGFVVTAQASTPEQLVDLVAADPPDLAMVDVRMPPTYTAEGLAAARQLRRDRPALAVLVLSHYIETQHVMRLLGDGASGVGYLLKDRVSDLDAFANNVRTVAAGGSVIDPEVVSKLVNRSRARDALADLTERERSVLAMMAEGRSNTAIGNRFQLSQKTVEAHVRSIFGKLQLEPAPDDHRRVLAVLTYLRS